MSRASLQESSLKSRPSHIAGSFLFSDPSLQEYGSTGDTSQDSGLDAFSHHPRATKDSIGADFFNSILASVLLRNHGWVGKETEIESKLKAASKTFPYNECLETIANGKRNDDDSEVDRTLILERLKLFVKIGSLLTVGSTGIESYLSACIKAYVPGELRPKPFSGFNSPPSPPKSPSQPSSQAFRPGAIGRNFPRAERVQWNKSGASDQFEMGLYMSRLKEHCDQEGWQYGDRYELLGDRESWWKAEVLVQGQIFEAEAKSKKDAKFDACKKACDYLNIRV